MSVCGHELTLACRAGRPGLDWDRPFGRREAVAVTGHQLTLACRPGMPGSDWLRSFGFGPAMLEVDPDPSTAIVWSSGCPSMQSGRM